MPFILAFLSFGSILSFYSIFFTLMNVSPNIILNSVWPYVFCLYVCVDGGDIFSHIFFIISALDLFLLFVLFAHCCYPLYCLMIKLCAKSITQASLATIEWMHGVMITSFNKMRSLIFCSLFLDTIFICAYCFVILLQTIHLNFKSSMKIIGFCRRKRGVTFQNSNPYWLTIWCKIPMKHESSLNWNHSFEKWRKPLNSTNNSKWVTSLKILYWCTSLFQAISSDILWQIAFRILFKLSI